MCSRNAIGYIDREGRIIFTAPLLPSTFHRTLHSSSSGGQKLPLSGWNGIDAAVMHEEEHCGEVDRRSGLTVESDMTSVRHIDASHDFESHLDEISCELQNETIFLANASLQLLSVEAKMTPPGERMELIEHVIATTVEAHMNTCNYTSEKVAEGLRHYYEMVSMESSVRLVIIFTF